MTLWFTSDTHFSHANTIFRFKRPDGTPLRAFRSVEEMDETLVARWNECVRPSDHIYHLGDVSMMRPRYVAGILKRLNGHKRLVRGNHDIYKTAEYIEAGFEEIYGSRIMGDLLFTHIPIHPDCLGGWVSANVHGHVHCNPSPQPVMKIHKVTQAVRWVPYLNISVEQTDYRPLSLEQIQHLIKEQTHA